MMVGTLSLVQKGQTSGCSGCSDTVDSVPTTICHYSTASTAYCILWFDLFVSKTMSLPPYTTILLRPLRTASTVSTGLNFLHQRQCPHHNITLFHCVLCPLHSAFTASTASTVYCVHCVTASTESTGLTFLHQRQCPHHHIPLFHCIHCLLCPLV